MRVRWLCSLIVAATGLAACGGDTAQSSMDAEPAADVSARGGSSAADGAEASAEATLVVGTAVYAVPDLEEPPPRVWYRDATFGTRMIRMTDRDGDPAPDDPSPGLVPEYSRVQAFNADGSRIMIRGTDGAWYAYDAATLLPTRRLVVATEPRWDPHHPNVYYDIDGTRLRSHDLSTDAEALIRDFAGDLPGSSPEAVWTRWEGRFSDDGRFWGLLAQTGDWEAAAFIVYDMERDAVTVRDILGRRGTEEGIDHVTMSPRGTYLLASFDRSCERDELGDDRDPCGLMVYDRDLREGRGLLRVVGHYDTGLDPGGGEVVVYQDLDTDHISMLELESGAVTPLWPIDFSHTGLGFHFSGLAVDRPGWMVVSTHDDDPAIHTWMDDQVFLVETVAGGRVVRLAHTHSVVDDDREADYWAEPHATTNRDLTRIIFGSNWGRTGSGDVDAHLLVLPDDWPDHLSAG